jgi:hypothetical protein
MAPVLAIAAPVRGEAAYLLEWIAYHRALGIHAFLLGDNGGDDGTSALLEELARRRIVVRLDWRGRRYFQNAFQKQAITLARRFADGLFLIDVDEFLRPLDGRTSIADVAQAWLADAGIGAVAINWAIFGSSGRQRAEDGLVIERFTRRAVQDHGINRHVKTFVRLDRDAEPAGNPHAVTLASGRYVDTRGADVVWDTTHVEAGIANAVVWHDLRVDHFVLKSRAEFEKKRARGSVASPYTEEQRRQDSYFTEHDRNEVEDPMPPGFVARTKAEMKRLAEILAAESS